jgi:hypothetical protein
MRRSGRYRAVAIGAACFALALLGSGCDVPASSGSSGSSSDGAISGSGSGGGTVGSASGNDSTSGGGTPSLPDGGTCVLDDAGLYACPDASWPACARVDALSGYSDNAPCSDVTLGTSCMGCDGQIAGARALATNYTCECAPGPSGPFVGDGSSGGPGWVCVATNYSCCVPGSTQCIEYPLGIGVAGIAVQTCTPYGTWGAGLVPCEGGTCKFGVCTGVSCDGSSACVDAGQSE